MWWIENLILIAGNAALFFLRASFEVGGWIWPGYLLQDPFYGLYETFWSWRNNLFDFNDWATDVWARVLKILDAQGIRGLIMWWFPWLTDVGNWFATRWEWLTTAIENWWPTVQLTVKGWIDIAAQEVKDLLGGVETWVANLQATWDDFWTTTFPEWTAKLDTLRSGFDNFWTFTFPTLADWTGVNNLIDSTLKSWFPFYDDLVDIWNEIVEFFTDPLEFLLTRFTDWFLGTEV